MRRASNKVINSTEFPNSKPFDLTTVKTTADNPVRSGKRIFGLQEAPTFYPTKEEFKDPLAYIEKISPEGEKYGIIKIVPPKDYHPEFSLKTENFRFKTRIQKLNSMEGETRTNVNYLEQLTKYHILSGKPMVKIPQLDKRPIDLYKLKNEVAIRGGMQEVTRLKKWAEIGRILGYSRKQCTSMSNALKNAYANVVLPYEIWYTKHKDDVDKFIKKQNNDMNDDGESDTCEVCEKNENEEELLLCDGCNRGYHMYCLNPPLTSVPKTDWYCIQCLTAVGKDYGFEDGDEYTLEDFHKFSEKFKKQWFFKLFGQDRNVTEEECENEFWRLVENPHETCEVEYGADLHSTQHGSGFIAPEQMPKSSFDPWNLNVIPVAPQSLFTHIKTDISGMMVPWLYIGMCFSAFCWHNEDHYTYSINYMHWGETKTWYGIPGSDTSKFEDTMRKAVPELFEQQPDLLFQLVTMLSPGRLLKENVKVYAVNQRPGQFVVTYPKAYHSGFNHGFNFCEAVNFAPGEWVDYGLECVKRYKEYRKQPCFSHDELLITAAQNTKSTENISWLKRGLAEMQTRELKERRAVRSRKLREEIVPDNEELQCVFCNCFTYLSFIGCKCTDKVSCLDHISELCSCDITSKTLYLRFTDEELETLTKTIINSGKTPESWIEKLDQVMTTEPKPTLKTLKELLKEGYEINVPQEPLDTLKDFIDVVDQWTVDVEKVLNLRNDAFKNGKKRGEKAQELMELASLIGFDLVFLDELKEYVAQLQDLNDKITDKVLDSDDTSLLIKLYNDGLQLRADSTQFTKLRSIIESSSWEDQVKTAIQSPFNPKNIRRLIKEGEDIGMLSTDGSSLHQLIQIEEYGKEVLLRIDNICKGKEKIDLEQEEAILDIGQNKMDKRFSIILDAQTLARLKNHLTRSKRTLAEIEAVILRKGSKSSLKDRPSINEAHRLMTLCRELSFKSDLAAKLSLELTRIGSWNEQVRLTFMNGRQKSLETVLKETFSNVERIIQSEGSSGLWCVCRKPEAGLMIECDICHEWYHSSCLKVSRTVVRSSKSYICPICYPSESDLKITHISRQPKIEEITDLILRSEDLKFKPKDYDLIIDIHSCMQKYRNRVQAFCRSRTQLGVNELPKIKYYLRTLVGLEVTLQDETEFLLSKIQTLAPVPSESNNTENNVLQKFKVLKKSENEDVKKLYTSVKPLASHHQEVTTQTVTCICQRPDRKTDLIKCTSCKSWSHKDCVQTSLKEDVYKCLKCSKTTNGEPSESNGGIKRATIDNNMSPKPQKIIKLTVKPPTQPIKPTHNGKKRSNRPNEEKRNHKKRKSL